MVKTEFNVTNVKTGCTEKAVLHTYITKTFFMIQGKAVITCKTFSKDFFFQNIMKPFIANVMHAKGKEIEFVNQFLKTKVVALSTWKRKMPMKSNQCDVCSRIFVNQHGVNVHKKKIHGVNVHKKKIHGPIEPKIKKPANKIISTIAESASLSRSTSVSSVSDLSLPPKKINQDKKKNLKRDDPEDMEESGLTSHRDSDNKVDSGIQCNIERVKVSNQSNNDKINQLEEDLKLTKEQVELMKLEAQTLKAHNTRKFTGYKVEY